ncbi:MAG: OmpA family protein [Elusimicrobiota bacterium]|jgi:OOP family OmpA-OmpF porin
MRIIRIIALILSVAACAGAEDLTGRFGAGGSFGGSEATGSAWVNDHAKHHWNAGGWLRYGIMPELSVGLSMEHVSLGNRNPAAVPVLLNGYYHILPESAWNPNAHLGLGVANVQENETYHGNAFTYKLGVGVDRFIHRQISVGAFLDYLFVKDQTRSTYVSHEMHTFLYGLTVGLWFGGEAPRKLKPAPVQASAPAPKIADADRDGVIDEADTCPGTPSGVKVDTNGCPKPEKVTIQLLIEFDTDKSDVKPGYDDQLMKVSEFMKTHPEVSAEIEGHTDDRGNHDYNMALSQRRAEAVRQALIDRFDVTAGRLTAGGYGPTRPVASNDTAEGRTKNRRVMATFDTK